MNVSDTLNTAADLIEERGWRQGSGMDVDLPGFCLESAIAAARGETVTFDDGRVQYAYLAARPCAAGRAVKEYLKTTEAPWRWNDAPERTAAEVVETLRAAAVIAEARKVEDARHARKVEAVRVLHGERVAEALVRS